MRYIKILLFCLAGTIIAVGTIAGMYRFDHAENRGWHLGYYGELNRIHDAISVTTGTNPELEFCNYDVVIEEFGFVYLSPDGRQIRLVFEESDPARSMTFEELVNHMRKRIKNAEQDHLANSSLSSRRL